jgi:hypothetical protein
MRHFLLSLAIAPLPLGVLKASPVSLLVAFTGRAKGVPACKIGATFRAVDIAPVTPSADHHLAVAASTVIQAGSVLHRRKTPMRT